VSTQVVRTPAYQILADDIRAEITSGRLRPGDRLPTEPQLSARFGLSRSTVREALRLLASQHLIITMRGVSGGSFVSHPSPDKLADTLDIGVRLLLSTAAVTEADLLEVREMLEVPAAAVAAERRTAAQLAELEATLLDPSGSDLESLLRAHRAFHLALAATANNPLYELITGPLYGVANERQLAKAVPPEAWYRIDTDHRRILRAIAVGDAQAASVAAKAHVTYLREVYSRAPALEAAAPGPLSIPVGAAPVPAQPSAVRSGAARADAVQASAPRADPVRAGAVRAGLIPVTGIRRAGESSPPRG
jgi:DNA-binding FadR family transcriptional regulator